MQVSKEPRRFEKRRSNDKRECFLRPIHFAATNLLWGETSCQNDYS
jgi:hypothetical protein